MESSDPSAPSGFAIVGIGCRFPGGAGSPSAFWQLLRDGVDAITEFPPERYDLARLYDRDESRRGHLYVRRGGTVHGVDQFDAEFFGVSPREAAHIDPQHRLLLEIAYEALDDAGISLESVAGSPTGVFVGISTHDYGDIQMDPAHRADISSHSNSGTATSIAANRISYLYDLRGPSLTVDTACSSSLTAVHLACESLRRGECTLALVGGVQLLLTPEPTIGFCKAAMLSPDEQCRAFDAGANGYVRSEGAGIVVVKPLAAALAAGDLIYAVIAGTAINQDGRTNGMTVPSQEAQAEMLRLALRRAGLSAADVQYVEAHGTGTPVGDPIEAGAIGSVLGRERSRGERCVIGSVKTNIGHLEAASGMAGLIKTSLAIAHREIPPSLHFHTPNPAIPFESLGLRVATELETWPSADHVPATAGVNSFGFGGANAHVLLRESPAAGTRVGSNPADPEVSRLLPISARSEAALLEMARAYLEFLRRHPEVSLADVAHTAALRRSHHRHRAAVVGATREDWIDGLEALLEGEQRNNLLRGRSGAEGSQKLAFVFGGMGPQWWGMGRELLREEPVFRRVLEECDALLRPHAGWSLLELLAADEGSSRVAEADVAQVTNFAIQAGLAELWKSWGIAPDAVIGHSAGGITAAHVAGVHDLADSIYLAFHRSRLQSRASGEGSMLAVAMSEDEATALCAHRDGRISLGAVNSPISCVLSGPSKILEGVQQELQEQGKFARMLQVAVPYHSAAMDPIRAELLEALRPMRARPASIRLVSDVTGAWAGGEDYDGEYWWRTVRQPVRFAAGVSTLLEAEFRDFLEVGPHPVLATALNECLAAAGHAGNVRPSLRRMENERGVMLRSLASLWVRGHAVDWRAVQGASGSFVRLPTYAWQHERHWFTPSASDSGGALALSAGDAVHPLLGAVARSPQPAWLAVLEGERYRWLHDHCVQDAVVFPGAAYVEMGLSLARLTEPRKAAAARDVEFLKALFLPPDKPIVIQTSREGALGFVVHSQSGAAAAGDWTLHARGRFESIDPRAIPAVSLVEIQRRCSVETAHDACYEALAQRGLLYGPAFRGIATLWQGQGEALGRIDVTALGLEVGDYAIHPALLDAAFQVLIGAASEAIETGGRRLVDPESRALFLPTRLASFTLLQSPGAAIWSHARVVRRDGGTLEGDIDLLDEQGKVCAQVRGLSCQKLDGGSGSTGEGLADWHYEYRWQPSPELAGTGAALPVDATARVETLRDAADEWSRACGWEDYYVEAEPMLNELAMHLAAAALAEIGWQPRRGEGGTIDELLNRLGVVPNARRLGRRLVETAAGLRTLSIDGGDWRALGDWPPNEVESFAGRLVERLPAYRTDAALMRRCGGVLAAVLRGDEGARGVLFSPAAIEELTLFYREAPASAYYNRIVTESLRAVLASVPSDRALRVLELGGGTGGCTGPALQALAGRKASYVFTDVSPFFSGAAAREFSAVPGFSAKVLDLERDLVSQGFVPGGADVVIAANVLHATADVRASLGRARELLAPGGMLLLLEITRRPIWLDVIFGVTEGWWKFRDFDLRPAHALLDPESWIRVLETSGFGGVKALADSGHAGIAGQTVFLAQRPREESISAPVGTDVWLISSDRGSVAARLADLLAGMGHRVVRANPASAFLKVDEGNVEVRPDCEEDWRRLLAGLDVEKAKLRGVVFLGAVDFPLHEESEPEQVLECQRTICGGPLALLQALAARAAEAVPACFFVTAGAEQVIVGEQRSVAQAPLWGLARVTLREWPATKARLIDLEATPSDETLAALARELVSASEEEEIVMRGTRRWVRRFERAAGRDKSEARGRSPSPDDAWQIEIETPGALATMRTRRVIRSSIGDGEVELAVSAAALNFRDVMLAAGMIPTVAGEGSFGQQGLGLDCAGRVTRVGAAVADYQVGDEVVAIAPNALASFARTRTELVARKPAALSFEQAAAIPCAFVTAYYALERLVRLSRGERVLIHAATGGVGLAALQLARAVGAEVFATAGSPEKRAYLKSLGVCWIFDSRSLAFADEIQEITEGRGVDVVLNSLAGEAIPRGLALLSPYGRFVEIGKRDIYSDSRIGLLAFRKNLSFFAVDLDRLCNERPAFAGEMLREVVARFERGLLQPLPQEIFPASQAEAAVRQMAQARHLGKVVLTTNDSELRVVSPSALIRGEATYLITGGLGGFGLATARWLANEGARSVVLLGRSEPGADARAAIESLRSRGVDVTAVQADVTSAADVRRVLADIREHRPPLRGVFHAAMVLEDAPLREMNWPRFAAALPAKMAGAWNLHRETRTDALDYFVLFSSIATIFGNPMQANYSAANAYLDSLAHYRKSLGLPALSVNWGVLEDVGYVSQHREIGQYLTARGYGGFRADEALRALGQIMECDVAQAVVARVDWNRLAASSPATVQAPGFRDRFLAAAEVAGEPGQDSVRQRLAQTLDPATRAAEIEQYLRQKVGKALGLAPQRLDPDKPLTESGLDSLIAVELVTVLKMELGFELPAVKILQGLTIRGLGALIDKSLEVDGETSAPARPQAPAPVAIEKAGIGRNGDREVDTAAAGAARVEEVPPPARHSQWQEPSAISGPAEPRTDYASLNYARWSRGQRAMRSFSRVAFALGARVEVRGEENLPPRGGYIIAVNHLSLADVPLVFTIMPRPVILLAAEWLRDSYSTRWLLKGLGNAIFVRRGDGDSEAMESAVAVLRAGGVIGLSPEGTRSRSGGLARTQLGMAYLARRAEVPVVPIASWGHEQIWRSWRRFRRPTVQLRVGTPITLSGGDFSAPELRQQTDVVMRALASLLPAQYRGIYADSPGVRKNGA